MDRRICFSTTMRRMSEPRENRIPLLLWPFYAIWRLLTFVVELIGRISCGVLGLALMVAGILITITVLAAPLGIPITALGFLLLVRAIF